MRGPEPRIGRRESGIERHGALQQFARLGVRFSRMAPPKFAPAQETVERLHIVGLFGCQTATVALREVERQRGDDLTRHVVLHGENVGEVAVEPLGP